MTQALRAIWPSYNNIANHLPDSAGCESLAPRLEKLSLTCSLLYSHHQGYAQFLHLVSFAQNLLCGLN